MTGEMLKMYKKNRVRISVWRNKDKHGRDMITYNIHRVYKKKDGGFAQTSSFDYEDIVDLSILIDSIIYQTALDMYKLQGNHDKKEEGESDAAFSVTDAGEVK